MCSYVLEFRVKELRMLHKTTNVKSKCLGLPTMSTSEILSKLSTCTSTPTGIAGPAKKQNKKHLSKIYIYTNSVCQMIYTIFFIPLLYDLFCICYALIVHNTHCLLESNSFIPVAIIRVFAKTSVCIIKYVLTARSESVCFPPDLFTKGLAAALTSDRL